MSVKQRLACHLVSLLGEVLLRPEQPESHMKHWPVQQNKSFFVIKFCPDV